MAPSGCCRQYRALLRKHATLARRARVASIAQVGIGLAVCVLLYLFQQLANYVLTTHTLHPATVQLPAGPPKCTPSGASFGLTPSGADVPGACTTILYAPSTPEIDRLLQRVANNTGLTFGSDIAVVPGASSSPSFFPLGNVTAYAAAGGQTCVPATEACLNATETRPFTLDSLCLPCAFLQDNATLTDYIVSRPNSTQSALLFFGAYLQPFVSGPSVARSYAALFNLTVTVYPFFEDPHLTSLKRALDQAALELAAIDAGADPAQTSFDLQVAQRGFPVPPPRLVGYDVFSANGGQWIFITPALSFFFIVVELVHEKESRLRLWMRQAGLKTAAFWGAWVTHSLLLSMASTVVLVASGWAFQYDWFTNANVAACLLLFFSFSMAMTALAALLSTFISSTRTAQTVAYSFVLTGFTLQFILTSAYASTISLLYASQITAGWVKIVKGILNFYPPFNFSLMFYEISALASSTINTQEQKLVQGPGFHWSDMSRAQTRQVMGYSCTLPTPLTTLGHQAITTVVFLVAALYLDRVLPGPHGTPSHPLFFLGCRYKARMTTAAGTPALPTAGGAAGAVDPGVGAEIAVAEGHTTMPVPALAAGPQAPPPAGTLPSDGFGPVVVRFAHMRVVYRRGWSALLHALTGWDTTARSANSGGVSNGTGRGGAGDVVAVQDLCLTVRRNECLALLGHNGCGKTSSLSAVTGLLEPAGGVVEVCGHDVVTSASKVQQILGVCPQHDILWPDLTARETCRLFADLKGIPSDGVVEEVERVLAEVRLTSFADRYVGGYSGGMKRRLSLAVASMGKPLVLLVDEPSSGADPVHRRGLWGVLQRLKKTSSIILTTHSMEEASVLGSRIAIMAHGRLHALGTPLQLKRRYGAGYRLNLTLRDATPAAAEEALTAARAIVPAISVGAQDASNLVLTVPFSALEAMPRLLRWVEASSASTSSSSGGALVREFGVSGPTLEAVFLKITAAAKFELAAGMGGGGGRGAGSNNRRRRDDEDEDDDNEEDEEGAKTGGDRAPLLPASGNDVTAAAGAASPDDVAVGPSRGWYALLAKNALLLRRQRGLCICQLVTPLLVLGLLVLLKYIVQIEVSDTPTMVPSLLLPLNMNQLYPLTTSEAPNTDWPWETAASVATTTATANSDAPAAGSAGAASLTPAAALSIFASGLQHAAAASASAHGAAAAAQMAGLSSFYSAQAFLTGVDLAAPLPPAPSASTTGGRLLAALGPWLHAAASSLYLTPSYIHPWTPVEPMSVTKQQEASASAATPLAAAPARGLQGPPGPPGPNRPHPHPGPPGPPHSGPNTDCLIFFLYSIDPEDGTPSDQLTADVGALPRIYGANATAPPANGGASGLLGRLKSNWCALKNGTLVSAPYLDPRGVSSSLGLDVELMGVINDLQNTSTYNLDWQAPCWSDAAQEATVLATAEPEGVVVEAPHPPSLRRGGRRAADTGVSPLPPSPYSAASDDPYVTVQPWLCPAYLLPDGTLSFHKLTLPNATALAAGGAARMALSYTYAVNDLKTRGYHRPSNFTRLGLPSLPSWVTAAQVLTIDPARVATQDLVSQAFADMAGLTGSANGPSDEGLTLPHIVASGTLPFLESQNLASFVEIVGGILYPIALSLPLPAYIFVTALERETGLLEVQLSMGLSSKAYHAVSYAMNVGLYSCLAGLFWGVAQALRFSFFTHSSPVFIGLLFWGWGLALCSMAVLLGSLLWSRRAATIVGYSVSLFGTLFAIVIAAGVYGDALPWSTGDPMPTWLYIFPQFALVRVMYLGTFNCVAKQACWSSWEAVMAPGTETRAAVVSLYLCALCYAALGLYLDAVLPRRYGVRKPLLFFIPADWRRAVTQALRCRRRGSASAAALGGVKMGAAAASAIADPERRAQLAQPLLADDSSPPTSAGGLSAAVELTRGSGTTATVMGSLNAGAPTDVPVTLHPGQPAASSSSSLFSYLLARVPYLGAWAPLLAPTLPHVTDAPERHDAVLGEALTHYLKGEDADVFAERQRIDEQLWPAAEAVLARPQAQRLAGSSNVLADYPLILRHLRKTFEVPKPPASKGGQQGSGGQQQGPSATAAATTALLPTGSGAASVSDPLAGSSPVGHPAVSGSSGAASDPAPLGLQLWGLHGAAAGSSSGQTPYLPPSSLALPSDLGHTRPYAEMEQQLLGAVGTKVAVSDLSLALRRGQCLGLLGENGAGKSTTMAMLLGLYEQSGGQALVGGYDTRTETSLSRKVLGVALQHDTVWPTVSVRETLTFYARVKGVPRHLEAAHVAAVMSDIGLAAFGERPAGALSGGMRRRLTLGTALVGGSPLILADEVTSGLDVATKRRVWRILARAKARGRRSILLISHDMGEVEFLCDTIGIATFGRLRCLGDSGHLKALYGGGLILSFNYLAGAGSTESEAHDALASQLATAFPGCNLLPEDSFRGFASFLLCEASGAVPLSVASVFEVLLARYGASGTAAPAPSSSSSSTSATTSSAVSVLEWSVSQQTLEGVFGRIVRHFRATAANDLEEREVE